MADSDSDAGGDVWWQMADSPYNRFYQATPCGAPVAV